MTRYPAYKPSGIEWIGEIPEQWSVQKLKYCALVQPSNVDKKTVEGEHSVFLCNYLDVYNNDFITEGMDFMQASASNEELRKFLLSKGDVLITKDSESPDDIAVPALVVSDFENVLCAYHLSQIKPDRKKLLGEYLFRIIQEDKYKTQFEVGSNGVTRFGLSSYIIANAFVPLPPISEQTSIANFLDEKTKEIDLLIAQKQKLIDLLKEERTAIINKAVTKGIDPNVKLKPSGIDWLGEIPEHWEVKKLKYVIKGFESGVSVNSADEPISSEFEFGVLKTSCVYNYVFEPQEHKKIDKDEISRATCPVRGDTLIISRMNTPDLVGASGYVDKNYPNLFLPDRLWQTIVNKEVQLNVKWLSKIFISISFRNEMSSKATGTSSSMKNHSKDDVLETTIPFPELNEQILILEVIERQAEQIEQTIKKISQEIDLIFEYRTALISEVVTGKIKVI